MIRDETDAFKMDDCEYISYNYCMYKLAILVNVVSESNSNNTSTSSLPPVSPPKVKPHISYNSSDQLLPLMVGHVRNLVSELNVELGIYIAILFLVL